MKDLYDHGVDVGFTKMWENQTFLHRNSSASLTASVMLDSQPSYETSTYDHLTKEGSTREQRQWDANPPACFRLWHLRFYHASATLQTCGTESHRIILPRSGGSSKTFVPSAYTRQQGRTLAVIGIWTLVETAVTEGLTQMCTSQVTPRIAEDKRDRISPSDLSHVAFMRWAVLTCRAWDQEIRLTQTDDTAEVEANLMGKVLT